MKKRIDKSGAEVIDQINRASSEAEWAGEELDKALRENGIDPGQLVRSVSSHVTRLVKDTADAGEAVHTTTPAREPLPVLGMWREKTSLKPRAIAEALGVTVAFVSDLNRHVKDLPRRWVLTLARRAEERLGVPLDVTLSAFDSPFQFARASSRDEAYEQSCPTCEELLQRSGMNETEQQFWLDLLKEGDA
jgi:hypothetical protein